MDIQTLLSTPLWGNSIAQWLMYIALLLAAFFASKALYWAFSKIFKKLTQRTKSNLDDLLVNALQGPVIFLLFIVALSFGGTKILTMQPEVSDIYFKIVKSLIIINVAWFIMRIADAFLEHALKPITKKTKSKADDALLPLFKKLINFVVIAITLIFILQYFDVEVSGLLAGLGIGGLAFALAAQDIIGNMFGGAAVLTDKPFEIGDRVIVEGQDGIVKKIGLRSTVLETFDGTNIVMPNKKIADSVLENVSREKMRRVKMVLGVEYNTSTAKIEKAKKLLADIVKQNKSTDDNSMIHFLNFGPSSLDIQLVYWIKDKSAIFTAKDEINIAIKKAFEKAKIEFAYPSQTIYVKK